ncbi:MAG: right-handed parallel beta-helix repeat-containing protein, partial [Planctomycetota bacterium]
MGRSRRVYGCIESIERFMLRSALVCAATLSVAGSVEAAEITVRLDGTGDYADLPLAIDAANDGDTVTVGPGEYSVSSTLRFNPQGGDPAKDLRVVSEEGPERTSIVADPLARDDLVVVTFDAGETEESLLRGFTISGGEHGGIHIDASSPQIENCHVRDNLHPRILIGSSIAAGISCVNEARPVVSQCLIADNWNLGQGGAVAARDSQPTFVDCELRGNLADSSAGYYFFQSDAEVIGGLVTDNDNRHGGAAFDCAESAPNVRGVRFVRNQVEQAYSAPSTVRIQRGSAPIFEGCEFAENFALAIAVSRSNPEFRGCLIAHNAAGGVEVIFGDSSPIFDHCTIVGNARFQRRRGGITFLGTLLTVRNSILWDNEGADIELRGDARADVTYTCMEKNTDFAGEGNFSAHPRFEGWANTSEVYVDRERLVSGDGSSASPFRDLAGMIDEVGYSLALADDSPCLGAGSDGSTIGADTGRAAEVGVDILDVHIASGAYAPLPASYVLHGMSLLGAGSEETRFTSYVYGLSSGAELRGVTVFVNEFFPFFGASVVVSEGEQDVRLRDVAIRGTEENDEFASCLDIRAG